MITYEYSYLRNNLLTAAPFTLKNYIQVNKTILIWSLEILSINDICAQKQLKLT